MSGRSSVTRPVKKRPRTQEGRIENIRAGLVAAMMITLVSVSKPSISTSNWFQGLLALVVTAAQTGHHGDGQRHQFSSTKTIAGEWRLALFQTGHETRLAPTPTNISTNSEPEIEKKGDPLPHRRRPWPSGSCPVPGAPTKRDAFGNASTPGR